MPQAIRSVPKQVIKKSEPPGGWGCCHLGARWQEAWKLTRGCCPGPLHQEGLAVGAGHTRLSTLGKLQSVLAREAFAIPAAGGIWRSG